MYCIHAHKECLYSFHSYVSDNKKNKKTQHVSKSPVTFLFQVPEVDIANVTEMLRHQRNEPATT